MTETVPAIATVDVMHAANKSAACMFSDSLTRHDGADVTWIAGAEYWSPYKAITFLERAVEGFSDKEYLTALALLSKWRKRCNWLGGRPLQSVRATPKLHQFSYYMLAADVQQVAAAMNARPPFPPEPGLTPLPDLAARLDVRVSQLKTLFPRWRQETGTAPTVVRWGRAKDGDPAQRAYVTVQFAEWAVRVIERKRSTKLFAEGGPPGKGRPWSAREDEVLRTLSPKQAAATLGRPMRAVYSRRSLLGLPDHRVNNGRRKRVVG